jgi:hypothetical protein
MNPARLWTTGIVNQQPEDEIYTAYDSDVRL